MLTEDYFVSASWDGSVYCWDKRSSACISSIQVEGSRVWGAKLSHNALVVLTSESKLLSYSLAHLEKGQYMIEEIQHGIQKIVLNMRFDESRKKLAIGSLEGRCSIRSSSDLGLKFSFKCHRHTEGVVTNAYPINDLCWWPGRNCVATAGGDGNLYVWDIDRRRRMATVEAATDSPVTAVCFNEEASLMAMSVGYDWHKGVKGM